MLTDGRQWRIAEPPASNQGLAGRIRILFVITSTAGGAGLQLLQLCQRLPRDRFDITVAFGPGYPLDPDFDRLGLPVLRLSLRRELSFWPLLKSFQEIYRELRRDRYDILCSACSIASVLCRFAGAVARVPNRVHILHAFASRPFQPVLRQRVYGFIERMLDPLTTAYVAVSEATRRFGLENRLISSGKAIVIHNGVEFVDPRSIVSNLRAELGWSEHPVICFAGRFEEQKGLPYFLEAARLVYDRRPDARFMVAGDGPLRADAEATIERLGLAGVVRLLGWRSDIANVVAAADIFCLSSLWEQFPLVLLEAMMLEKAVVSTAVDGVPEAAIDGETALLVPPRDATALAGAVISLLDDPALARRLARRAAARVSAMFTVERMVSSYEQFFSEMVANGGKPAASLSRSHA